MKETFRKGVCGERLGEVKCGKKAMGRRCWMRFGIRRVKRLREYNRRATKGNSREEQQKIILNGGVVGA